MTATLSRRHFIGGATAMGAGLFMTVPSAAQTRSLI
ncbi:MAG: twin-arginine translocation signal domain-containing protein, partial [Hyphomicrobiaceae bacterium]